MKRLLIGIVVLGFVASLTALAEEKAATPATPATPAIPAAKKAVKEEPAAAALAEITVSGKISKEAPKMEGGKAKYILTTAEGAKITLPETKAEVADLEKFVGKDVKVVGKGKEDKFTKKIQLKSITKVEEAVKAEVAK